MSIRRVVLVLLLAASLLLLTWSAFPTTALSKIQTISRSEMQLETPSAEPGLQSPAVLEERLLSLEWPGTLRQGDESRYVQLTLAVAEDGAVPPTMTAEGGGSVAEPVWIPDVYDTHNVMA